ncbi:MAG: SGNH/GDSL hydrolase family protein [Actinomycetes bacterium]
MSRRGAARRVATAAAYGGGGLVGIGAAAAGVLVAEGYATKRTIGIRKASAPYADGLYGPRRPGTSLRLVVLGDSAAAGLGAAAASDTIGALLAQGLVNAAGRPVRFINMATVGARSSHLDAQVSRALLVRPHAAVVLIGGNDVTHFVLPQHAVRDLGNALSRLTGQGCEVVVGTCPDLGAVRPIPQPLRWVARRLARQMAAAQTIAVVESGGRSVSLGGLLGPAFDAYPDQMFAEDGFHPSSAGYAAAAEVLLPSLLASLGFAPPAEQLPMLAQGDAVLPVSQAAVDAADASGTEVVGVSVRGKDRGPKGRWVLLRRRIVHPLSPAESPEPLPSDHAGDQDGSG